MGKVRNIFFVSALFGLVGCATLPPPKPLDPQRAIIGIAVKTRAPLRIVVDKADQVYFIKIHEAGDLYTRESFIRSTFGKDGQVYFLNAKPGRYAAVACYKRKPLINFQALSFFSKELIRLTEVTVDPGTIVFAGEYVVDQAMGVIEGDDAQVHYAQLSAPGLDLKRRFIGPFGEYYYSCALHKECRDKQAEIRFMTNALEHLKDTGWTNIILNRIHELKAKK